LVQWFWRKSQKCKSLQTDRRTTGDQNSSLELLDKPLFVQNNMRLKHSSEAIK
jgi:hypothetical protein